MRNSRDETARDLDKVVASSEYKNYVKACEKFVKECERVTKKAKSMSSEFIQACIGKELSVIESQGRRYKKQDYWMKQDIDQRKKLLNALAPTKGLEKAAADKSIDAKIKELRRDLTGVTSTARNLESTKKSLESKYPFMRNITDDVDAETAGQRAKEARNMLQVAQIQIDLYRDEKLDKEFLKRNNKEESNVIQFRATAY